MSTYLQAIFTLALLSLCAAPSACSGSKQDAAVKAPPTHVPAKLEKASLSMGGIEGNGLKASAFACRGSGNLFSMVGNVGGLSTQKEALQACVSGPEKPRVHWTVKAKKVSDIRVADASSAKVARCIADAIAKIDTRPGDETTCIATLDLGK